MPDNIQNINKDPTETWKESGLSSQRRSVLLVCIASFFYWAAMYLYVPQLPVYAQSLGANLTVVGIVVASYAIPQLVLRIPLGIWSDFLGRQKPLVAGGIIMVLLGSVGLGLSPSPFFLGISRALVGVGAATWVVFTIYLVSLYPQDNMGRAVGLLNAINGAALVVTTLAGGIIADVWSIKSAFFVAGALAIVSVVIISFAGENRIPRTGTTSWSGFRQVARRPLLILVSIMGILLFFSQFASVWGFIPVYAAKIGASNTALGILTMTGTGASTISSLMTATIARRWGHAFTIIASSLVACLSLLAVPFIHSVFLLGAVPLFNGLAYGILATDLMALSIYKIAPQQRASAMGFFQAIYAIGMLAGPLVSGYLADNFGLPITFYLASSLCLVVAGMAFLPVLPGRSSPAHGGLGENSSG